MKVFGLWHGGSSYALGDLDTHLEVFPSKAAARVALDERERHGYGRLMTFHFADGRVERVYTPAVDRTSSITLYLTDPREAREPYPDLILSIGPRGGVRETAA